MTLHPCPECASEVSSLAATCPHCGCPASLAVPPPPPQVPPAPEVRRRKKDRPRGHIGALPSLIVILGTIGVVASSTKDTEPARRHEAVVLPKRGASTMQRPVEPAFDEERAAYGRQLHARLLAEAGVQASYGAGFLHGALTSEPKAAICVPTRAWAELSTLERETLMHHAASLVDPMRELRLSNHLTPLDDPSADESYTSADAMTPRSWIIQTGSLHSESDDRPFDLLADEIVASGAQRALRIGLPLPEHVVAALENVGLTVESGWARSNYDGCWFAMLRIGFGRNEVSCLIESRVRTRIETIELEAELHLPGVYEQEVMSLLGATASILCGDPALAAAIEAGKPWSSPHWEYSQEHFASTGGYGWKLIRR